MSRAARAAATVLAAVATVRCGLLVDSSNLAGAPPANDAGNADASDAACTVQRSGPRTPRVAEQVDAGASYWRSPQNARAPDDLVTWTVLFSVPGTTNPLVVSDFGFDIPSAATVLGVQVDVREGAEDYDAAYPVIDEAITLHTSRWKSARRSRPEKWLSAGTRIYGSNTDRWDAPVTAADVDDPSFGVELIARNGRGAGSPNAGVDAIQVTVFYCVR